MKEVLKLLKQKELTVIIILSKLAAWTGKLYVYPGRRKIIKLCRNWLGVHMSERTLSRVLASLQEASYIERQPRPFSTPKGYWKSHTSLTYLKGRTFALLSGLGRLKGVLTRLTDRPKMARNIHERERSSAPCGKLGDILTQVFHKGRDATVFLKA